MGKGRFMGKISLPPYTVQILTGEYLIEGTVAGDTNYCFSRPDVIAKPLRLSAAKIQLIRSTEKTVCYCQDYIFNANTALAYLPQIDLNLYPQNSSLKYHKTAYTGAIHLGPYTVTGRLMISSINLLDMEFPVFDASFTTLFPGSQLGR